MPTISRRTVLGGVLAGAALATTGCSDGNGVVHTSGSFRSSHWARREIRWQVARPEDGADDLKPVVVVLHGKGGDSSHAFDHLHLDHHALRSRLTIASVDGGNHYWHARRSGVDASALVIEDFLPLVARETGYAGKVAFLGWSMGGYGSLLLASQLGPGKVAAVVAESAALWTEPGLSAPGAFDDREDFERHDVFEPERLRVLRQIPVRLDCGRSDAFVPGNEAFASALPTATFTLDEGDHTHDYWRSHAGAQLGWIRQQLDAQ